MSLRLRLRPVDQRYKVLVALRGCRGRRAFPESLLVCLDSADKTPRRLHNVCATLFQHGLIEKQRGMYWLTDAGLKVVGDAQ